MRIDLGLALLGIGMLAACQPLPGEVVGTYAVTMSLEENTCGITAVHPLDGKKYSVELRDDDDHAYWRIPGQTPIQGKYDAPSFEFEYSSIVASNTADAGVGGCRLLQTETLTGRVALTDAGIAEDNADAGDAGVEEGDDKRVLAGEHKLTISPQGDCTEAFAPKGAFEKLPCLVRYELNGVKRKPL